MSKKKLTKKPFCGWSRSDIEDNAPLVAQLTSAPGFVCRKCARVANHSKQVCKPMALPPATALRKIS